jgi:uncharacterized membrane protein YuzA (DUF378 family)
MKTPRHFANTDREAMEAVDAFGADATYYKKLAFKFAMVFVILGALNGLVAGVFRINPIEWLFGRKVLGRAVYIIIGLLAVAIMFDRDTYLPFLGPMVVPCSVLKDRTPSGATRSVQVKVRPGAKVLYWAAEPSGASEDLKAIKDWKRAYAQYENAGVATAGEDGVATLRVREPQPYWVPMKGSLQHHVHYRVCGEAGWMERVQTVFLE